jgi:hypothetical protein
MTVMVELEHSPLGGSAAKRFLNCGASFLLQRLLMVHGEYENPPTSDFADKGTAAHTLGEICLTNGHEPFEYVGKNIGRYNVHKDDLDPDAVSVYVNYCQTIMAEGGTNATSVIERTYHLREIHPLFKGTVDFGHWRLLGHANPGIWLIDYKNGEGIGVDPYENEQLLYYAVLFIMANPDLRTLPRDFPVALGIVQPNYFGVFTTPDMWFTTVGTVLDWGHNILMPSMQALLDDKRTMIPEDEFADGDHCQFCPVMLECPKLRRAFETYAHGEDFLEMLSNEELSDLYALRDGARRYGNQVEQVVFARKLGGQEIASAKLVEKMVHRVWKAGAEAEAQRRFGEAAYNPRKMKSPAQMEKISSDGKAFALEHGFKPDSERLTVAPLSDRRPEAQRVTSADIFKNFVQPAVPIEDMGW